MSVRGSGKSQFFLKESYSKRLGLGFQDGKSFMKTTRFGYCVVELVQTEVLHTSQ